MKNQIKFLQLRWAVLIVALVGFQACKKDNNEWNMDNQQFVTEASSSNSFEIAAGNLAAIRSLDTGVVSFAQQLVEEHGPLAVELTVLATSKGWTIPTQLLEKHQNDLERIQDADSADFDRVFADIMVESHEAAINLFASGGHDRNGVADSDLRAFASAKLPGLQAHLQAARELRERLDE